MIEILLSTYNGERYLAEQLDSILAQTCTNWHLTIRDDGSKDNTPKIIADYCGRYPQKIASIFDGKNIGVVRSFETLLKHANADYYMFSDQDDVWLPTKIEASLQTMKETEKKKPHQPIVVHTDLVVVDEDLAEMHHSFWRYSNICPSIIDTNVHYQCICNSVTGCTMFFNHDARQAALPFPANIFMHDAWIATSTFLAGGLLKPIYTPQMLYRQHRRNVVGAIAYRFTLADWKNKWMLASRAYHTAHPQVWRNWLHFLYWKMKYTYLLHTIKE